jgi:hypothetical protein
VTLAFAAFSVLNWVALHAFNDLQAPDRKKTDSEIRRINRDLRTLATHQLESSRANREILQAIARKNDIPYGRPPELEDAERDVRKLKSR